MIRPRSRGDAPTATSGRASGRGLTAVLGVSFAALVALPGSAVGQAAPDSVTQEADSTRLAIMRRLERLGRAPGADSILYLQDSARVAAAELGVRPGGGPDSISTALFSMPGYSLTEYEGESADFAARERLLELFAAPDGRARVVQEGSTIEADTAIVFNEATGSIRAVGGATFTPPEGDPVDAANMVYDLGQSRGTALNARTSWEQDGATWVVRGDMPYAAQDSTFMAHARFTSCELEEPHYHFETDEIKIVGGNVLVARGVRLYFADVPVAWLPFMAQSLSRGRSSGILTPRFSVNDIVRTSGGYQRRLSNLGFYWAMNDYSDGLFALDWFSQNFLALTTSFQYRVTSQFLSGDLSLRRYWNADGSKELALDTRHDWQMDERTQLRISARFINNSEFVREYSMNPLEVTQSIDSEAGINRRFDWGTISASANRQAYLSDDRTEWLLPSLNASISPITLFRAPSSEAGFFNNMTWSGTGGLRRQTVDRVQPDTFAINLASTEASSGFARSNLSLGNLTFSQSVDLSERKTLDVPEALVVGGDSIDPGQLVTGVPARDIAEATLGWATGINYQQQLIGSTTITPRLSVAGSMFRSTTEPLAQNFVAAPTRLSFGATLRTDIYGFFGGVGSFEAIRHKLSPEITYEFSPETAPNDLQREVFGSRVLQPKNAISLSLTQTFEAKRPTSEGDSPIDEPFVDSIGLGIEPGGDPLDPFSDPLNPVAEPGLPGLTGTDDEPRRLQQSPSVTLLAWRTSIVRYDFVEADSVGFFLSGFETTRLSNQFSSDFLRGMSISMDHELFEDVYNDDRVLIDRRFDPHLAQLNLGFSLGSSSSIFRWLGFGGDDRPEEPDAVDPLSLGSPTDEVTIVPRTGTGNPVQPVRSTGSRGGWTANVSYSLLRPRDPVLPSSQALSGTIRLEPTDNWSLSWRTSYDLDRAAFNDHSVRLSRDLHRWQANFDFLQTATGNWTFRFEVSLLDNRDLKFDYRQRNLDLGLPPS